MTSDVLLEVVPYSRHGGTSVAAANFPIVRALFSGIFNVPPQIIRLTGRPSRGRAANCRDFDCVVSGPSHTEGPMKPMTMLVAMLAFAPAALAQDADDYRGG